MPKKHWRFIFLLGRFTGDFLASNGFENETKNIFEEYKKNGLESNHELVPESMVSELCIAGTPDECKTQLVAIP